MRILHASATQVFSSGIYNQLVSEHDAANSQMLPWTAALYSPKNTIPKHPILVESIKSKNQNNAKNSVLKQILFSLRYHKWLLSQSRTYDALVLRYRMHDPVQMLFSLFHKKPIFFVHHTLEIPEIESTHNLNSKIKKRIEQALGRITLQHAFGIIGVTKEIVEYELSRANINKKPTLIYPNGIDFTEHDFTDRRGPIPEFLFVASQFYPWHGLDILIDSATKCERQFIINVVGNASDEDISRATNCKEIIFHGQLDKSEIARIADRCWVGLGSFALFRKKMTQACTLKVREYLVTGLPVYSGHKDVFPETFQYYTSGKCKMDSMISFAEQHRHASKQHVAQAAIPYIQKSALLKNLYHQITKTIADQKTIKTE